MTKESTAQVPLFSVYPSGSPHPHDLVDPTWLLASLEMSTGTSFLENLTYDCIAELSTHVDFKSLKNLRLVSRKIKDACTKPHFMTLLRRQKTDLSEKSLQKLLEIVSHAELGPAVKEIRIIAPLFDDVPLKRIISIDAAWNWERSEIARGELEEMHLQHTEFEEALRSSTLDLLKNVFQSARTLNRISLEMKLVCGPEGTVANPSWGTLTEMQATDQASLVYSCLKTAIAESDISLDGLSILTDTRHCGVFLQSLTPPPSSKAEDFKASVASVRNLSIKISSWACYHARHEIGHEAPKSHISDSDVARLKCFLEYMPNLDTLHLGLHNSYSSNTDDESCVKLFDAVIPLELPSLRRCTLGGIYTNETSLLRFLQSHSNLKFLSLQRVLFTSGKWDSIFDHISKNMQSLNLLCLSCLLVNAESSDYPARLVNLYPSAIEEHQTRFRNGSPPRMRDLEKKFVHSRLFDQADVIEGLRFEPMPNVRLQLRNSNIKMMSHSHLYGKMVVD